MEQQRVQLKQRGLFAVLDIEQSTQYVFEEVAEHIVYRAMNLPHCGLFHESDDLLVAELLAECVQANYAVKDITDD